jgi:hypothetical protein
MSISKLLRFTVSLCGMLAGSHASAQSAAADCEAAKNTTMPVELSYHLANGAKAVLQSYRQPSDENIVWMRVEAPNLTFVTQFKYVGGVLTESHETTTLAGKRKATARKFEIEGYPKNFDRRSDIQYKITLTATYADGTSEESSGTNSYKFKSEDKITIGSCAIKVVYGETESTDPKTGKTGVRLFQVYFPELKMTVIDTLKEPVIDELKTNFAPITPVP